VYLVESVDSVEGSSQVLDNTYSTQDPALLDRCAQGPATSGAQLVGVRSCSYQIGAPAPPRVDMDGGTPEATAERPGFSGYTNC
jgi:hypothetical protein